VKSAAGEMKKNLRKIVALGLCAAGVLPGALLAQQTAPAPAQKQPPAAPRPRPQADEQTAVMVDGSEAMFTTMCALLAAGFQSNVSADNWSAYRAQMRERMQQQKGPAVDALREYYRQHELRDAGATLSKYLWFGLVSGSAPKFQIRMKRDEMPPEVINLEGFSEILSAYFVEQNIGQLWRQVQPVYNREIARLHDSVAQTVFVTSAYLREIVDPTGPMTFLIVVEPLVGRITNVRNFGDHYSIVLSGGEEIPTDVVRHAFLHFLVDRLPLRYSHVVAVKRPLFELAARAPRLDPTLKDDFDSYFAECMVRAVELKLKRGSPGEREAAMSRNDEDGYVLVRPLFQALGNFEKAEPSMTLYFPDMVRTIDVAAEVKRVGTVQFAQVAPEQKTDQAAIEEVARRRRLQPTTLPNDAEAIAALTEGERRIAEKNPRAAQAAFEKVLVKYPDQIRAWFGLGMVAVLDHDAVRAKQVFGRLTTGEHAADKDPMVLAWSHIYLARIYDDEGSAEQAKTEYQSALAVQGGPDQARQAAEKGLAAFGTEKRNERP
jgi:hypothetical protein